MTFVPSLSALLKQVGERHDAFGAKNLYALQTLEWSAHESNCVPLRSKVRADGPDPERLRCADRVPERMLVQWRVDE